MGIRCARAIPIFFLIFFHVLYGCARVQLKDVVVKPASDYKAFRTLSGLNIAVDPYLEEERIIEVFGDNLISRGYLPILIVIENRTADRAFLVTKADIQLLMDPGSANSNRFATGTSGEIKDPRRDISIEDVNQRSTMNSATAGTLVLVPGVGMGMALMMAPTMAKAREDAYIITRNLEKRELVDRTVYPGESHSGFVYVPQKRESDPAGIRGVELRLKDLKTREPLVLSIPIRKGE